MEICESEQQINQSHLQNLTSASAEPRFPRWTRQEILVLIQAKMAEEKKGRKNRIFHGKNSNSVHETKWVSISSHCKRNGVNKEAVQCRKRWCTLSRDYKKIREYERSNQRDNQQQQQSFWVLRSDLRREFNLPGFFDRELYGLLDKAFGCKETDFDVVKQEEEDVVESPTVIPSPVPTRNTMRTSTSPNLGGADGRSEEPLTMADEKDSAPNVTSLKRTRESSEEDCHRSHNLRHRVLSILERNGRALSSHIESHNLNCQLDRNQRNEEVQSLVGVLGKLADALGRIADKLD
eukprot:TRINITY_DN7131_c0_g1_i1.p1 TRINITY_DN7131_c0_g1~~TRINITY_DN7131_c0_g1_i1.p1  ORF type:complete len:293 (+),score=64.74 TRINITY_DN7131_c0_g1_i1:78-956(+)